MLVTCGPLAVVGSHCPCQHRHSDDAIANAPGLGPNPLMGRRALTRTEYWGMTHTRDIGFIQKRARVSNHFSFYRQHSFARHYNPRYPVRLVGKEIESSAMVNHPLAHLFRASDVDDRFATPYAVHPGRVGGIPHHLNPYRTNLRGRGSLLVSAPSHFSASFSANALNAIAPI